MSLKRWQACPRWGCRGSEASPRCGQHQPIEQHFVGVLQRPQVNVPGDIGGMLVVGPVPAVDLLLHRLHHGGQQTTQAQFGAFLLGEGGALVRQRVLQHPHPGGSSRLMTHSAPFLVRPTRPTTARHRGVPGHALRCPLSSRWGPFPSSRSSSLRKTAFEPGMPRSAPAALYPGSAHQCISLLRGSVWW